jgi:pyrroline-5-carboxylate reductase
MLALQAESMDWLSRHNVDPDQARNIIDSVLRATSEIDQYRKQLTTRQLSDELRLPGGITEFGLKMFEESGSIKDWSKVMDAVLARLSKSY